jgi:GW (Gly-Tryp) dipeptide domain
MNTKIKPLLLLASLAAAAPLAQAGDFTSFSGKVVETTNTAGYTYVQVDTGSNKVWAAATQFAVKVGDPVTVPTGMPMYNYHSRTLNRDFDLVYFTDGITVGGGSPAAPAPALPPGHPPLTGQAAPTLPPGHPSLTGVPAVSAKDLAGIQRAAGGQTIAEIYAAKAKLAGQAVTVRGKVVKYNAMILGKNWLHIQDGSGTVAGQNNDLTVTTATEAKVGDTVLVTGTVATDKDFGAGYKYSVMLPDARVTVE